MVKKVVFFWNKTKEKDLQKFLDFLLKYRKPYLDAISKIADLCLVIGEENYLGGRRFGNHFLYRSGEFLSKNNRIGADVIFDRTMGFGFPEDNPDMDKIVINSAAFKDAVRDKYNFSKYFPEYSPTTFLCKDRDELAKNIDSFSGDGPLVIKPLTGRRGEGVRVGSKKELIVPEHHYPVILQEFVETMGQFMYPDRRHDIRLVILNGKIVHAFARFTNQDPYRANISQGGDYLELTYEEIPENLRQSAEKLATEIKDKYHNPFYSIDFGIAADKIYIFEMNNKIGFPESDKKNFTLFRDELIKTIEQKID
jgi:glutathione synthase/RimK-type ligase-like ATP-grasp enzyme